MTEKEQQEEQVIEEKDITVEGNVGEPEVEVKEGETPFDTPEEDDKFDPNAELREKNGMFLGKYKTIEAALDGYRELSKKLHEKAPTAPEGEYKIEFPEDSGLEFNAEDPMWQKFEPMFREANLPNEVVNNLVVKFNEHMAGPIADLDAEKEKLGVKADERIEAVDSFWLGSKVPEKFSEIVPLLKQTATGVEFLEFAMENRTEKPIPTGAKTVSRATIQENEQRVKDWKAAQSDFATNEFKQNKYDQQLYKALSGDNIDI